MCVCERIHRCREPWARRRNHLPELFPTVCVCVSMYRALAVMKTVLNSETDSYNFDADAIGLAKKGKTLLIVSLYVSARNSNFR